MPMEQMLTIPPSILRLYIDNPLYCLTYGTKSSVLLSVSYLFPFSMYMNDTQTEHVIKLLHI